MKLVTFLFFCFFSFGLVGQDVVVGTVTIKEDLKQADSLIDEGSQQDARITLSQAASLLPATVPTSSNYGNIASFYYDLSNAYYKLRDYSKAKTYAYKSLQIIQETDDTLSIVSNYILLGTIFEGQWELDSAEYYLTKALHILPIQVEDDTIFSERARCYSNLGVLYLKMRAFIKAREYRNKALEMYTNRFGTNSLKAAVEYNNMGLLYDYTGDYYKAIAYKKRATKIWSDSLGNKDLYVAIGYTNIGLSYSKLKLHNEAMEWFNKGLEVRKAKLDPMALDMVYSYNNIGVTHVELGNYEEGLRFFEKSRKVIEKHIGKINPYTAFCHKNIGVIYQKKRDHQKALISLERALDIQLKVFGDRNFDAGKTYSTIAKTYHFLNEKSKRDSCFDEAYAAFNYNTLDSLDYVNSIEELINTIYVNGSLMLEDFRKNTDPQQLKKILESCDRNYSVLNYQRNKLSPSSKSFLSQEAHPVYEHSITTYTIAKSITGDNNFNETFKFCETSKALKLLDAINEYEALEYAGIPDSLLQREYNLRTNLSYIEQEIRDEPTSTTIAELEQKKFELEEQYEKLKENFVKNYPKYYDLKYNTKIVEPEKIQNTLTADQALIEYFVGDSSIFIFTITPDQTDIQAIKKDASFETLVAQVQEGLLSRSSKSSEYSEKHPIYVEKAYQLYKMLIDTIPIELPEKLIIVPDGVLGYLPFDALLTELPQKNARPNQYSYLLKQHQISYAYSTTLLQEMKDKQVQPKKQFLAFAPSFPKDTTNTPQSGNNTILATRMGLDTLYFILKTVKN